MGQSTLDWDEDLTAAFVWIVSTGCLLASKLRNGYARTIHGKMKITIAVVGVRLRWDMFTKQVTIHRRTLKLSVYNLAIDNSPITTIRRWRHALDKRTCGNISQAHRQFSSPTMSHLPGASSTPYLRHDLLLESLATHLPKTFPTTRFSRIEHAPVDRFGHKGHREKNPTPPTPAASAHESTRDRYTSW